MTSTSTSTNKHKAMKRERPGEHTSRSNSSNRSSIYPLNPIGSTILYRVSELELSVVDRIYVILSSLAIIGSVVWVPAVYVWLYRRWKRLQSECNESSKHDNHHQHDTTTNSDKCDPLNNSAQQKQEQLLQQQKRRRAAAVYAACVIAGSILFFAGPHRSLKVGKWWQVRKWKFLTSWIKFVAMEIVNDDPQQKQQQKIPSSLSSSTTANIIQPNTNDSNPRHQLPATTSNRTGASKNNMDTFYEQAILAFVPHGIFPFGYGFGFLPQVTEQFFGQMRPVVAPATFLVPLLRDFIQWCNPLSTSSAMIGTALQNGDRIGINPGGIEEIFLSYPKPGTDPHTEYCIVRRGFLRLAYQNGVPVYPIYCFGATKMFRRLELPFLEQISHWIRMSIVLFYGKWGLPIPYRQKLKYVIGTPIVPPSPVGSEYGPSANRGEIDTIIINRMHAQFCNELNRLFERHKDSYGWSHKKLEIVSK